MERFLQTSVASEQADSTRTTLDEFSDFSSRSSNLLTLSISFGFFQRNTSPSHQARKMHRPKVKCQVQ